MAISLSLVVNDGETAMIYDVIIIGAGLAGCSAAIRLAAQGVTVLLLEQAHYPTQRLCGEFLSVEVLSTLSQLGVLQTIQAAGAQSIRQTHLTTSSGAIFQRELPGTALGLSRYQLDAILFERSRLVGADCRDGTAVRNVTGTLSEGFRVSTSHGDFSGRLVLGAFGKRSSLDRQLNRNFVTQRSPWVACKAHYSGIDLANLIELHAFPGGYCGLSPIEAGQINVCWIAHEHILKTITGADERFIPAALYQNSFLAERLQSMQRLRGGQSLSQISFAIKPKFDSDLLMIGDAGGMIAPLCGDGMAMALRSAELAVPLVMDWLQGQLSDRVLQVQYQSLWEREFKARLQLGRLTHSLFTQPLLASIGVNLFNWFPSWGDWVIRATRGEPARVANGEISPVAL